MEYAGGICYLTVLVREAFDMGKAGLGVLITQCLQNDFVKPLAPYTPLPNLLHVGHDEARRLMGDDPAEGPVARFLAWALTQPDDRLRVVHIRDWHDPADPAQREHLAHFGPHCLRGTDGAAFAFPSPPATDKQVVTVDGDALNDFLHSDLGPQLARIIGHGARALGVVGVWTEAKVTFLAYELRARYPDARIGVCAALTAGSSRAQHFAALDQLQRLLGVEVFASVAGFVRFLAGDDTELPLPPRGPTGVTLELEGAGPPLGDEDRALVSYLFRDCRTARLRRLDGGFSGNLVLMAESVSLEGHPQAAHVVKAGPVDAIAGERTAFERIEAVLGNSAPRIVDFADYRNARRPQVPLRLDGRRRLDHLPAALQGGRADRGGGQDPRDGVRAHLAWPLRDGSQRSPAICSPTTSSTRAGPRRCVARSRRSSATRPRATS